MEKKFIHQKGFTMIELVTSIIIISIVSVAAGMGLVQIARGYLLAKKSTVAAEQVQVVLTRLGKEFSEIEAISSSSSTSMTYTRSDGPHTLAWSGADQPLTLDNDTLIDRVQSFGITYYTYNHATRVYTASSSYSGATCMLELTLQIKGYDDVPLVFVQRKAI